MMAYNSAIKMKEVPMPFAYLGSIDADSLQPHRPRRDYLFLDHLDGMLTTMVVVGRSVPCSSSQTRWKTRLAPKPTTSIKACTMHTL